MEEVYAFLDNVYRIADNYFKFFYNKSLSDIKRNKPSTEEEYSYFKGESKSIEGLEDEFIYIFYPLVERYANKECSINTDTLIAIVEKALLATDKDGRVALTRRILKKAGIPSYMGEFGISELCGEVDSYWPLLYDKNIDLEGIGLSDDRIKMYRCRAYIEMTMRVFIFFLIEFKELCRDFCIEFEKEVDRLGYDSLRDIVDIEFYNIREPQNDVTAKNGFTNEFTNNRKRIAIEALLAEVGKRSGATGNIPSAKIQRFAYFLTGSGNAAKNIDNTAISKAFKDKDKRLRLAQDDNEFVSSLFADLGLNEIAKQIKEGTYD